MREHFNPCKVANTVRMLRDGGNTAPILLVEGDDDARLLRKFLRHKCRIIPAFGKENASSALFDVQSLHGILAVLDADFDRILQKTPASSNIILTDTHDIECMLVASTALDQVLVEFGSHEKLATLPDHSNSVRNILLESARPIALLLLAVLPNHSETEPAFSGLCLSDLKFTDIIDDTTLETDIGLLIRAVKNRSQRQDLDENFAVARLRDYCARHKTSDPWQLCRGHDMTAILLRGLFSRLGSQKPCQLTQERLEASLRLAYSLADFEKTSLHNELSNWSRTNPEYALLD